MIESVELHDLGVHLLTWESMILLA